MIKENPSVTCVQHIEVDINIIDRYRICVISGSYNKKCCLFLNPPPINFFYRTQQTKLGEVTCCKVRENKSSMKIDLKWNFLDLG